MGNNDEKVSRSSSIKRTRSLSESIKGLFKPTNIGANNSSSSVPRNSTPSTPVMENPTSTLKKNNSRLGKLATNKEAELSSSRGAPAPSTPVQTPVGQKQHHLGLANLAKLSLAQGSPPSSSENERISQESFLSEDDDSSRPRRHAAEKLPEDLEGVQEYPKSGIQRQRHAENKHYVPQVNPDEQDANQLIDTVLENDNDANKNSSNPNQESQAYTKRNRRNSSSARSRSLKRADSTSSSSASEGKVYPKGRSRADTFSASSLPRFSEIESKCILQVENFKVYENGVHEHNLKITSLVSEANDAHFGSDTITKQKSGFSLSGIFKPHKEDNKQLENALSLIPASRLSLYQRIDKSRNQAMQSEEGRRSTEAGNGYANEELEKKEAEAKESRPTPKIVNPNAAVGTEELKLINALSEKIHRGLSGKVPKSETEDGKKDCPTKFYEQYGTPIGVIGHGAYGVVKICSRPKNSKDIPPLPTYSNGKRLFFAVKELRPKANDQMDKFSTRITSEFIIGHSLSHKKGDNVAPNILRVLDLMESPDAFVEVMEFCPSGDLYNLLTRKSKTGTALHPLEADCFMKQLLNGVQFMHRHGVAHCDLKPENILFHPNGLLKICDFGTSCVFQTAWEKQVHFQSGTMGSEPYVAPEEFIHGKEYDPRLTDCWSCGVVYCTMVLGHYLWKVALRGKDMLYDSFYDEMVEHKEFYVFEEMRHVNNEIGRLRKIALYNIFQVDPVKRITVDELLQTAWMKRTRCCVFYKPPDRDR